MKLEERMVKFKRKLEAEIELVYNRREELERESFLWCHYNSYFNALESTLSLFRYWFFPRRNRDPEEIIEVRRLKMMLLFLCFSSTMAEYRYGRTGGYRIPSSILRYGRPDCWR